MVFAKFLLTVWGALTKKIFEDSKKKGFDGQLFTLRLFLRDCRKNRILNFFTIKVHELHETYWFFKKYLALFCHILRITNTFGVYEGKTLYPTRFFRSVTYYIYKNSENYLNNLYKLYNEGAIWIALYPNLQR